MGLGGAVDLHEAIMPGHNLRASATCPVPIASSGTMQNPTPPRMSSAPRTIALLPSPVLATALMVILSARRLWYRATATTLIWNSRGSIRVISAQGGSPSLSAQQPTDYGWSLIQFNSKKKIASASFLRMAGAGCERDVCGL